MASVKLGWKVEFHDDFDAEFENFDDEAKDALLAAAKAVRLAGPKLERPTVGTLRDSRHSNMKELRYKTNNNNEIWRAAFAFDPNKKAIIFCAAEKQGVSETAFYKALIAKADDRFDSHIRQIAVGKAKAEALAKSKGEKKGDGKSVAAKASLKGGAGNVAKGKKQSAKKKR